MTSTYSSIFNSILHSCFYSPINFWRQRIRKETKRKGGGGQHPNSNAASIQKLEQGFANFLREAITLFEYLVTQYKSKLLGPTSYSQSQTQPSSQSQSQSQEEFLSAFPEDAQTSMEGVVTGIYRLLIFLGDLHRYNQAYATAEATYHTASKLAPGLCQHYNQLAVTSQIKDSTGGMTCVPLYWYARAILSYQCTSTHNDVTNSMGNLQHLFKANRQQLEEYSRSSKPQVLPPKTNTAGKTMPQEELKARKSAVSKSCLLHFVNLHDLLLRNHNDPSSFSQKIQDLMDSLRSLLEVTALGDNLLSKMAVINIFTVEKSLTLHHNADAAISLLLEFTTLLLQQLQTNATHKKNKTATIRLLLPALISLEYLEHFMDQATTSSSSSSSFMDQQQLLPIHLAQIIAKHVSLWKSLAQVSTLLQKKNFGSDDDNDYSHEDIKTHLKEYQELKGFKPLIFLFSEESMQNSTRDEDFFVSPSVAVDVLGLNAATQSQTSQSCYGNNNSDSISMQNSVKSARLFFLLGKLAENPDIPIVKEGNHNGTTPVFSYADKAASNVDDSFIPMETSEEQHTAPHQPLMTIDHNSQERATEQPEKTQNSTLTYQLPKDGVGPALLVPAAFSTTPAPPQENLTGNNNDAHGLMSPQNKKFDGKQLFDNLHQVNPANQQQTSSFLQPPPGFGSMPMQPQGPQVGVDQLHLSNNRTVPMDSSTIFPGIQSDAFLFPGRPLQRTPINPFDSGPGASSSQGLYNISKTEDEPMTNTEDLLGTELLNSLWMDNSGHDKSPRNPFG
jgi:hypothetical protein